MSEDGTSVALLTAGDALPAWSVDALDRMLAETDAEITLVVEDVSSDDRSALDRIRRVGELREWGVVAALVELVGDDLDAMEPRPIADLGGVVDAEWMRCEPETVDGWKHALPDRAVRRVAETDLAVRFGFGVLVGDALTAPEMGVLSFHHGDLTEYRGQPMGFWEYVHDRDTAGVTLQRINETLDAGEIVVSREVDIADAPTWAAVRRRLFDASRGVLAAGVDRLQTESFEPQKVSSDELGDLYTHPKGRPVATYLRKTAGGRLRG